MKDASLACNLFFLRMYMQVTVLLEGSDHSHRYLIFIEMCLGTEHGVNIFFLQS